MINRTLRATVRCAALAVLLCCFSATHAQDETYYGGTLDDVTVPYEETARKFRQLLDVDMLLHSLGAKKVANDERLVAFVEGFMERNDIGVVTISYVDSDDLWPSILKNNALKKIEKAPDATLVAGILFFPEESIDGETRNFTASLVLEGKTNEVYDLLNISGEDMALISEDTSDELIGNQSFSKPKEAQDKVVNAMIAALQKVEQIADPTSPTGQVVTFRKKGNQKHGFDLQTYEQLQADYPTIVVGGESYLTAWKSLKATQPDEVIAIDTSGQEVTFELDGIPVNGAPTDGRYTLSLQGSSDGTEGELLAKVGETTVGKLNTVSYSISSIDLKIVPVNGAGSDISQGALQRELDSIYAPAVASWNVQVLDNQQLGNAWDPEGNGLDDGETGSFTNYTDEMNDLIKEFKRQNDRDKDAYYIFLVDRAENASKLGYMPRKKQWGFVFTNGQSTEALTKTIAHELGHGVYRLEHTFSEKGLPKGQTDNLMDYSSGKELYKYQWDYVHDPASVVTLFDDEEEAAYEVSDLLALNVETSVNNPTAFFSTYAFSTPAGGAIKLPKEITKLRFNRNTMALYEFELNDIRYVTAGTKNETGFLGYVSISVLTSAGYSDGDIVTDGFKQTIIDNRYSLQQTSGRRVYGMRQELLGDRVYATCYCSYNWEADPYSEIYGSFKTSTAIPQSALIGRCTGEECNELNHTVEGMGAEYYTFVKRSREEANNPLSESEDASLRELVDWLTLTTADKITAFHDEDLEVFYQGGEVIREDVLRVLYKKDLVNKKAFETHFQFTTNSRDYDLIFSTKNLRKGISEDYNANSYDFITKGKYEYSLQDLSVRYRVLFEGADTDVFKNLITNLEQAGAAEAISIADGAAQYKKEYGTNSAFPYIAKAAAEWSHDMLVALFIRQLVSEFGIVLMNQLVQKLGDEVVRKQIRDKGRDFVQGAIIDYGFQATFSYAFDDKTFSEAAHPDNINWISVGASGLESTLSYKNKYAQYGISMSFGCFVNGWSDNAGFKDDFDFQNCAIGIVGAGLSKQIPLLFKYTKKFASYSIDKLKAGLAKLNITGQQADEVIEKIKNNVDADIYSSFPSGLQADIANTTTLKELFDSSDEQFRESLLNSWKALQGFTNLRKIPNNLLILDKARSNFIYNNKTGQDALEEILDGHKSAQKFLNNFKKYDELLGTIDNLSITGIKSSSELRVISNSNEVGKFVDEILQIKYSGFGGDVICDLSRTTTLLGKWKDPDCGGTCDIIDSRLSKSGQNPGGANVLSEEIPDEFLGNDDWIWDNVNEPWLRDAANRGDIIRVVSDPNKTTNIYKQGSVLSFFGREHELLTKPVSQGGLGYTYNSATFTYTR